MVHVLSTLMDKTFFLSYHTLKFTSVAHLHPLQSLRLYWERGQSFPLNHWGNKNKSKDKEKKKSSSKIHFNFSKVITLKITSVVDPYSPLRWWCLCLCWESHQSFPLKHCEKNTSRKCSNGELWGKWFKNGEVKEQRNPYTDLARASQKLKVSWEWESEKTVIWAFYWSLHWNLWWINDSKIKYTKISGD